MMETCRYPSHKNDAIDKFKLFYIYFVKEDMTLHHTIYKTVK